MDGEKEDKKKISENDTSHPKSAGLSVSQSIREIWTREGKKEGREKSGASRLGRKKAANMDLGRFDLDCACRYYGVTSELGPSWKNRKRILLLMSPAFFSWAKTAEKLLPLLLHGLGVLEKREKPRQSRMEDNGGI
ncbi:hypothetical protein LI328DRAFT_97252 [Trichoderma asperelloides]|nr:hypothetical protein LI328DRAFT_97252 [Trichoderma asperelloides]